MHLTAIHTVLRIIEERKHKLSLCFNLRTTTATIQLIHS